jgi:transposase, IS5 family
VDATIIHAPSSTKNREQKRDPEMHQTKKGNQWYFGMKAHVGVDSKRKIIQTAVVTPANVADSTVLPELLHGEETRVWGDQAYQGQTEVIHYSFRT